LEYNQTRACKRWRKARGVVTQAFILSTGEAKAGRTVSSRPAWSTEREREKR